MRNKSKKNKSRRNFLKTVGASAIAITTASILHIENTAASVWNCDSWCEGPFNRVTVCIIYEYYDGCWHIVDVIIYNQFDVSCAG